MSRIVFASDFHLGMQGVASSAEREKALVAWIYQVAMQADEVFFLGDLFDFWFEYKRAIPKGFIRFQGALAALCDQGKSVHLFIGNHDMWMFDYFEKELNLTIHRSPIQIERQGKQLLIGHGDGLGPGDHTFKFIRRIFHSPLMISLFRWVHPDLGIRIAHAWSQSSRESHREVYAYKGPKQEYLLQYCEEYIQVHPEIDYLIFGHRHLVIDYVLSNGHSRYINTGDWLRFHSYGIMEQGKLILRSFNSDSLPTVNNDTPY